jgi:glycerophosphoryl diester phosphodiesterase
VQQRIPAKRVPPIGFAHRGARAHSRENTIEAFTLALRLGATGLESDVWLTADGVAVLDHDGVVRRGMRTRAISTFRRADLPTHIPSLADLYAACGTDYELSLDLKDAAVAREVINVTRAADPSMAARLWLCHHDWTFVASLRELDSDVRLVDSTRLARIREGPERRAATLAENKVDAINLHYSDWTGGLTTLFHRFDRYCLGWDLQHERLLREGVRMGLDGVFSDWVDRMTVAIDEESG